MSEPKPFYRLLREAQSRLEEQADRIEAQALEQADRLKALESAAGQRIRGLEATVAEQHETLLLSWDTLETVMDVCRRHGFDPACGRSAVEWLEVVLDNAAAGWPSMN